MVVLVDENFDLRQQQQQADDVRDDDQAEERVGQAVQEAEVIAHTTNDAGDDVDPYPNLAELESEEELSLLHAVEGACQHGGEYEQEYADRDEVLSEGAEYAVISRLSESTGLDAFELIDAGGQDNESSRAADDGGVNEDFEDTPGTLTDRVIHGSGAVGRAGGTETGLVGIQASGKTPTEAGAEGSTGEAAGRRLAGEGIAEDGTDRCRKCADVHDDNDQSADQVDRSHDRNELIGNAGNTLRTADNDDRGDERYDDRDGDLRDTDRNALLSRGSGLGSQGRNELDHEHESVEGAEESAELAERGTFLADLTAIVERTADILAFGVLVSVSETADDFHELRAEADEGHNLDPENSARAAESDCYRNADDVGSADGGSQRGGRSRECGYVTFTVGLTKHLAECLAHDVTEMSEPRESEVKTNNETADAAEQQKRNSPEPVSKCQ